LRLPRLDGRFAPKARPAQADFCGSSPQIGSPGEKSRVNIARPSRIQYRRVTSTRLSFSGSLSDCVGIAHGRFVMRSLIHATTTNGFSGRQGRTGVVGMVQLRKHDARPPRLYCDPVSARPKDLLGLRSCRGFQWREASCRPSCHREDLGRPRGRSARPCRAAASLPVA
jgi:hypothetical protein